MFGKYNKILLIILAMQVAIIAFTSSGSKTQKENRATLLTLNDQIDSLEIAIPPEEGFVLKNDSGNWVLPELDGFPADKEKIEKLVADLSELKILTRVGSSKIAAKQLKTAESDFEAKVSITSGDKNNTVYFGSVPTFKQIYARVEGKDDTYAVAFQKYELGEGLKSWFSKNLLHQEQTNISAIDINEIVLSKKHDKWLLGKAESENINQESLERVLGKIAKLNYNDLPEKEIPADFTAAKKVSLSVSVGDQKYNYSFALLEDDAFVKLESKPYYFKIGKNDYEYFNDLTIESFVGEEVGVESVADQPTGNETTEIEPVGDKTAQ